MLDISLPAHTFFTLGPVPITDGILGSFIVSLAVILFFVLGANRFSIIPSRLQLLLELVADYLLNQLENAFHSKARAREFFPLFMTMLLILVVANQFMLVPFVFEITYNHVDLFRQPTSDFALPIAYSLLVFFVSHWMAFKTSSIQHLQNFIAIKPFFEAKSLMDVFTAIVGLFVGLLNIVGEFAKVVSIAARLFGNIFAGNVMLAVIISLSVYTQFIVPIPFLVLSVFSGLVQAFVFVLLGIQFIALAIDGATPIKQKDQEIAELATVTS